MGLCESGQEPEKKIKKAKNLQLFNAPIRSKMACIKKNMKNSVSQIDIKDIKQIKFTQMYKYKGTYNKKGEFTTLISATLEMQGNSLMKNRTKDSRELTRIEETDDMDENSGYCVEYITDGKMNKEKVIQSNDKNTIDNYIEFADNTNDITAIKNKINIYNKKKQIKK